MPGGTMKAMKNLSQDSWSQNRTQALLNTKKWCIHVTTMFCNACWIWLASVTEIIVQSNQLMIMSSPDWVDSSGVRFYLTPTLRRFDGGIIELGLEYTDKMAVPPQQPAFALSGYCITECTGVVCRTNSSSNMQFVSYCTYSL